jgi:DNA-binding NarL/FixJ family response regulator
MASQINLVIADDHPIFRTGLVEVIARDGRFAIVGEAADGATAQEFIQKLRPTIALLDIDMPKQNGLALAEKLRVLVPSVAIVILSSYKEESLFNRALDLGVKGYVLKENAVTDVLRALEAVAEGGTFFSPSVSSFLVNRIRKTEALRGARPTIDQLTPMELRVLRLVAANKTSAEIGKQLFISPRTVDTHRNNICTKLNLHGSRGLLVFALEQKDELDRLKLLPSDFK